MTRAQRLDRLKMTGLVALLAVMLGLGAAARPYAGLETLSTDCNNMSYNLGGDSPEKTLTPEMYRKYCE